MQLHKHTTQQSYATQSEAKPETPNPHTGRETGLRNLSQGPSKTAHSSCIIDLQRETEEKAHQPEIKLSAIAQTSHKARRVLVLYEDCRCASIYLSWLFEPVVRLCVGLGCSVRLRFALRSLALWHFCAIAPSFVSGWRAFSSASLCVDSIYVWNPFRSPDPLDVPPSLGPGACGDIMFLFPRRLVVGDVSVIHLAAASFAGDAARTPGFAAAAWDGSKRRAYRQVSSTLPFAPCRLSPSGPLGLRP
jgi:hypothetical protein